ncbi:MAG: hypothetical protein ACI9SQ_002215, partial [Rubritalea sp.]
MISRNSDNMGFLAVCRTSFCENSIFYPELNPAASEPTYLMT